MPNSLYSLATGGDDDQAPPARRRTTDSTSAAGEPVEGSKPEKSQSSPASTTAVAGDRPSARCQVRGRVVDRDGDPVGGLYVYTGTVAADAFVPTSATPGGDHRRPRRATRVRAPAAPCC